MWRLACVSEPEGEVKFEYLLPFDSIGIDKWSQTVCLSIWICFLFSLSLSLSLSLSSLSLSLSLLLFKSFAFPLIFPSPFSLYFLFSFSLSSLSLSLSLTHTHIHTHSHTHIHDFLSFLSHFFILWLLPSFSFSTFFLPFFTYFLPYLSSFFLSFFRVGSFQCPYIFLFLTLNHLFWIDIFFSHANRQYYYYRKLRHIRRPLKHKKSLQN